MWVSMWFSSTMWFGFYLALAALARPPSPIPSTNLQSFGLIESVTKSNFAPKNFAGSWISDTAFVFKDNDGNIMSYDVRENMENVLVKIDDIKEFNITGYSVSPNEKYILFKKDVQQGFRHSSTFRAFVFNLETKEIVHIAREMHIQLAKWVPGSNGLIYVRDNNVFYKRQPSSVSKELQLTLDGEPGVMYNGAFDWAYEEEIFGSGDALWFSPNGDYLAIGHFNDSYVDEMMYFRYGESGTVESQYPDLIDLRYPKPGRTNPTAKVKVIRLSEARGRSVPWRVMKAPVEDVGKDHILADTKWASDNELAVTWLNRRQNVSVMQICHVTSSECKTELKIEQPNGWINVHSPWFYPEGNYITINSVKQKDGKTYPHLVIADRRMKPKPITSGNRTVMSIIGLDSVRDHIFYVATSSESSSHKEVYVAGSKSLSLTGQLRHTNGERCRYGNAVFSKNYSYAALSCDGPNTPTVVLYDVMKDEILSTWESNQELKTKLEKYSKPIERKMYIRMDNGFDAIVRLLLPPNFNENKQYPMIVNVYAGPGSKKINDAFSISYAQYVTTNKSYIHCEIDGRGSAYRSDELMFQVNNALGTAEIEDQISVTKKLTEKFQFIDSTRVSIWGWSYGGYATAMTLIRDKENVFKCGISVAPVTSWLYYDTFYTERYMGLPSDNEYGYNNSDVTLLAEGLRDKRYLLIHGNADDNVHYQHSMQLVRKLELLDIPFQSQSYPNEAHGLTNVLPHVYHTIDGFFTKCLE